MMSALAALLCVFAFEAYGRKLDPLLETVLRSRYDSRLDRARLLEGMTRRGRMPMLVRTTGDPRALTQYGARVNAVAGNIASIEISPDRLESLASAPMIVYLEAPRRAEPLAPSLDISMPAIGADRLRFADPALTGAGVAVGFIDTGLDLNHPGFRTESGRTRVLAAWDQIHTRSSRLPDGYSYGTEWTPADIDAGIADLTDRSGHGTTVAGIAVGNGRVDDGGAPGQHSSPRYVGAAPMAGIIAVRTSYFFADILDGAEYIFRVASQRGIPCVLNVSFGSSRMPHDGRGLLSDALQTLAAAEPGRVIVAAAGNLGDDDAHAMVELREGDPPKRLYVKPYYGSDRVNVEGWAPAGGNITAQLLYPTDDGEMDPFGFPVVEPDQVEILFVTGGPAEGLYSYINYAPTQYADVDRMLALFAHLGDLGVPISDYMYAVELSGSGTMHAYASSGRFVHVPSDPLSVEPDGNYTVNNPADADDVIAVGSVTTRNIWQTLEGFYVITAYPEDYGVRSSFSSIGPRVDGGEKPDVVAPGGIVIAPYSRDDLGSLHPFRQTPDGRNRVFGGTSAAAAHVSGLAALLLQTEPFLTSAEARERAREAGDGAGWSPEYGTGLIDAYRFLGAPRPPSGVTAEAAEGTAVVSWTPNEESGVTYRIELDGEAVGEAAEPPFELTGLGADAQVVRVRAVNENGQASPPSQAVSVTGEETLAGPIPEIRVTNFNQGAELSWDPIEGAEGYGVIWGVEPDNLENSFLVAENGLALEGMENGQVYYFAAAPVYVDGTVGAFSPVAQAHPRPTLDMGGSGVVARAGFPFETEHDIVSSPAVADVTGGAGLEIFIGGLDGTVYGFDANGNALPGWPQQVGAPAVGSVSIGDLDLDGVPEIAAVAGSRVYVWDPSGNPRPGFPADVDAESRSSAVLANIDGSPELEILVSAGGHAPSVHGFSNDGSPLDEFPLELNVEDSVYSTPTAGDLNLDGKTEIYQTMHYGPVYSWDENLEPRNDFPLKVEAGAGPLASPVLAALGGEELSLLYSFFGSEIYSGVAALNFNAEQAQGFPTAALTGINAPVSAGDVDGDGAQELAAVDINGHLYVWRSDGTQMEPFPIPLATYGQPSALLADLDGDGAAEIIAVGNDSRNYGSAIYFIESDGTVFDYISVDANILGCPTLADLDGDGTAELIAGTLRKEEDPDDPVNFPEIGGLLMVWDTPYAVHRADWTTGLGGAERTGVAPFGLPPASVVEDLSIRWTLDGELTASWASVQERGNIGWRLLRSDSPDGPFLPVDGRIRRSFIPYSDERLEYVLTDPEADPNEAYYYQLENFGTMNRRTLSAAFASEPQNLLTQWGKVKTLTSLPLFPNPANPEAWIPFSLGRESELQAVIYDAAGNRIRTLDLGRLPAGDYTGKGRAARWDGKNALGESVASGLYFVELIAGSVRAPMRRLLILK